MENIITTEEGLLFKKVVVPDIKLPCDFCTYQNICDDISDPRGVDGCTFLDYCSGLEDGLVPMDGTIEKVMKVDTLGAMIKKDPEVKVSKVIDTVCPGLCDSYKKDHSECNSTNRTCILRSLLT